jgi:hypothetical protein
MRRLGSLGSGVALIALLSLAFPGVASAGLVSIQWDPSPDPAVIGYRVSVGTSPGVYSETFDVGARTYFVYVAAQTRTYYLAVAAYTAGPRVGPLSQPVSATPRAPVSTSAPLPPGINDARSFYSYLWSSPAPTVSSAGIGVAQDAPGVLNGIRASMASPPIVCGDVSADCYTIRTVARYDAAITSLSASADDRLFFIEDGQRVGVIAAGVAQPWPVLTAGADARLTQIALDPSFSTSNIVYVGETAARPDGQQEFRIARYRVVANQALERAVLVSMPLGSPAGEPVFAVGFGELYVAVPADEQAAIPGVLLPFNGDGTVPDDQHGSPIYATGYWRPSAIAFDQQTARLWLAGMDENGQASVSSLGESTSPLAMPAVSLETSADRDGLPYLLVASERGGFGRALVQPDGSLSSAEQIVFGLGLVRGITATPSGELFVVAEHPSLTGSTFSILRLSSACGFCF